jgi:hypothetical protein
VHIVGANEHGSRWKKAPSTFADRYAALYRPYSYFRVGLADVSRKSLADTRLLRGI